MQKIKTPEFKDKNYTVNDEQKWHQMVILMSVLLAFRLDIG